MVHYWSPEGGKASCTLAIKLLPGRAIAAHISLAKSSRVAKLDSKVAEKVESSPHPHRKGQLMVNTNTVGPESRRQGRSQ